MGSKYEGEMKSPISLSHTRICKSIFSLLAILFLFGCQVLESGSMVWEPVCIIDAHRGPAQDVAFNPDGSTLVTVGSDGEVNLWRVSDCEKLKSFSIESGWTTAVAFSEEGEFVTVGTLDGDVILLDSDSWLPIEQFHAHHDAILDIDFSDGGSEFATASLDGLIRIWSLISLEQVLEVGGITSRVNSVDFSPEESQQLLTAHGGDQISDIVAVIWDIQTGREINRFSGHMPFSDVIATRQPVIGDEWYQSGVQIGDITSAKFSPDGVKIATVSNDGALIIREVETGEIIQNIPAHESTVSSVSYSPDGRWILTTSWDGSSKLWDVTTLSKVAVLMDHGGYVNDAAFDPKSERLATVGYDGSVSIWVIKD